MRIRNTESLFHEFNMPVWFKPGGSLIFCSCISAQVWVMLSRLSWTSCWPRLCRLPATSPTSSCRSCLGSPTGPRHNTGRRRRRRSGPPHLHQGKPGYRHRSVPANRCPLAELGTRQLCRDTVTMFSGLKVVGYCIITIFLVVSPFIHGDLTSFRVFSCSLND